MKILAAQFFAALLILGFSHSLSAGDEPIGFDIMQKYHFHTVGTASTKEFILPKLSGANWGLKQSMSKRAGYDLTPHAGQSVSLIRYDLEEKYYQTDRWGTESFDLSLWVIAKKRQVLGAFITCRGPGGLIPGVLAVNDPGIKPTLCRP